MSFNLAVILSETAHSSPDRPVAVFTGGQLTYRELDEASDRLAASLTAAGIRPGDPVALQLPNVPQFLISYFGILKAGGVVVPLNVMLRAPEVAFHLDDSGARVLITWEGVLAEAGKGAEAAGLDQIYAERPPAVASWAPALRPSLAAQAADDLRDGVAGPLRQLAAAPGLLRRAKTEDLMGYSRGLAASVQRLAGPSASFLNGPIGPRRRWAWTTANLSELKQIRATHGGTINDIVLAAITGAFRDLLAQRHELTEGMVVRSLVPVSVRGPDEAGATTNRVSAVLANLPAGEPDPIRRLSLIRQEMDGLKHTHQAVSAEILTAMLCFAAPMWLALGTQAAFRIRQPLVQTVTTNVPGPRSPLYLLGRRLMALYPYVPIGNAVRISVAILSYVDSVSFGVTADYDSSPDLDVFVEGIRRSLAELSGPATS